MQYGAMEVLGREYGAMLLPQAEPEYNVSMLIDLEQAPQEGGESDLAVVTRIRLIGR